MECIEELIKSLESESNLVWVSAWQIVGLLTRDKLAKRIRVASGRNSIGNEEGELLDEYFELRKNVPSKYSNAFLVSYCIGEFGKE